MRIVFLLVAMFIFNEVSFCQWKENEDPLTIKELKLTKQQEKEIRKINSDASAQIEMLKNSGNKDETSPVKIDKVNGTRIKKIRNSLTPEQQVIWRKKMTGNTPRRGVTGLPYE